MKDISPILHALGLVESEIKTYLRALENGPSPVLELARLTGLSRQATYDAIESLSKRGLMTSAVHEKKRLFAAEDPERLLDYARRRENEVREHLGELERLLPELKLAAGGERPTVKVFEGKEGILAMIEEMQRSKPDHADEITDADAMYAVLSPEDLLPMRLLMKRLKVKIRTLVSGQPGQRVITDAVRQMLPEKYVGFHSNITVYENKIALVTFEGKMQSILIESLPLAKTLRVLFDLAFQATRDQATE